jgi:cardiolipin synthase (CMP-forming)
MYPNMISGLRLVLSPVLVFLAFAGSQPWFLALFVFLLFTDVADGYIARKFNLGTKTGPILDSVADLVLYSSSFAGSVILWPDIMFMVRYSLAAVVAAYIISAAAGLLKFHQLPNYHTWSAKIAAVTMSAAGLILFIYWNAWPFRIAALFLVLVLLENLAITIVLPCMQFDVLSIVHALRIRREGSRRNSPTRSPSLSKK